MADGVSAAQIGNTVRDKPDRMARTRLLNTLASSWIAQACFAVADLGVPDLLARGPHTAGELATETGADASALRRILTALASAGLLCETAPGTFGLTATSELLRSDSPASVRSSALMYGEEVYRSFAEIMYTVRTGKPAFDRVYGKSFYAYLAEHPEAEATFSTAQGGLAVPFALSSCDLSGVSTLVDIGGGNGRLLGHVLTAYPGMRGVLLERPGAIRQAGNHLADLGVLDRAELVTGDFFRAVPSGADVYVLSRCLHNWADDNAVAILETVRSAMVPGSRLIVLEEFLQEGPGPEGGTPGKAVAGSAKIVDLLMLLMLEGRDRSEREYRALLARTGFEILAVRPARDHRSEGVIEARVR